MLTSCNTKKPEFFIEKLFTMASFGITIVYKPSNY